MDESQDLHEASRKLGEDRVRISKEIGSPEEWKEKWPAPAQPYPFVLTGWRQCLCYSVADYEAEAGFLIDVVGLTASIFGPNNALLTSPDGDFAFQIAGIEEDEDPTPAETIALMFSLENIREACEALEARGVEFTEALAQMGGEGSTFYSAEFMTPHGVAVNLWGTIGD